MNAKQIRAALRNFHAFKAAAERENVYEIEGPGGEVVSLLDMEEMLSDRGPLPPRTREAILLSLVEDMPPAEVAERMGVKPGSVAQLVNNGLKAIEERLNPDGELA